VSFDRKLLDIVCCPVTHLPLEVLPDATLGRLNTLIRDQKVKNRGDAAVTEPLEEALVTRDGRLAYPVRDGIPVLLEEDGIVLSQVTDP
jgi:uncharacterized protein YbaR (Trm112 family)